MVRIVRYGMSLSARVILGILENKNGSSPLPPVTPQNVKTLYVRLYISAHGRDLKGNRFSCLIVLSRSPNYTRIESRKAIIPRKHNMSAPSPVDAPPHVLQLLHDLHQKSLEQEAAISKKGKVFSSDVLGDLKGQQQANNPQDAFDQLMLDKFIALDEDKCQFTYQLINAMGATNIVEAGTSFGVSTIYLALAVAKTKAAAGKPGTVIATEKEKEKTEIARQYWAQCGPVVEQVIDLREGDLLETLKDGLPREVDLLLLDSELSRCQPPFLFFKTLH